MLIMAMFNKYDIFSSIFASTFTNLFECLYSIIDFIKDNMIALFLSLSSFFF